MNFVVSPALVSTYLWLLLIRLHPYPLQIILKQNLRPRIPSLNVSTTYL